MNLFWLPVQGTWAWRPNEDKKHWWMKGQPFPEFLATQGLTLVPHPDGQFIWTTDLDPSDWKAGGRALAYYLRSVPYARRNLIVHSHGLQPALEAAKHVRIRRLISVGSPVREDTKETAIVAKKNIGRWLHLYGSGWKDWWIRLGQIGDKHWGWRLKQPFADDNQAVKGADHGSLLHDPKFFPLWVERGWIAFLKDPIAGEK